MTNDETDLRRTAALLKEVWPGSHAGSLDYLRWLYAGSPFGTVYETNLDDDHGRTGHYAVVPMALEAAGNSVAGALSLNTAVHERARGGGVFVRLATETYDTARAAGVEVVIGVANASSTPGFLRRLEFSLLGSLPVRVIVPRSAGRGVASGLAADAVRAPWFQQAVTAHATAAPDGLRRRWDPGTLEWRLRQPGARYALHGLDGAAVVSCRARRGPVSVAVLLKVLSAAPLSPRTAMQLVGAACRFHRAPVALHAGVTSRLPLRGVPLPQRLRPSPLNLILRPLVDGVVARVDELEFLDFDAY